MNSNVLENYLSLAEAASQLEVSKRTLVRWGQMRKGPPATRIGRKNFYRVEAIREWLEGKEGKHHKG